MKLLGHGIMNAMPAMKSEQSACAAWATRTYCGIFKPRCRQCSLLSVAVPLPRSKWSFRCPKWTPTTCVAPVQLFCSFPRFAAAMTASCVRVVCCWGCVRGHDPGRTAPFGGRHPETADHRPSRGSVLFMNHLPFCHSGCSSRFPTGHSDARQCEA